MSFKLKVYLMYSVALTLALLVGVVGISNLAGVRKSGRILVEENYSSLLAVDVMLFALDRQDRAMLLSLLEQSPGSRQDFAHEAEVFEGWLESASQDASGPREEELVRSLATNYQALLEDSDLLLQASARERPGHLLPLYYSDFVPRVDRLRKLLRELRDANHHEILEAAGQVQEQAAQGQVGLVAAVAGLVLVGTLIAIPLGQHMELLERERAEALRQERKARAVAEAANHAKDRFLANVSHDLRAPLAGVLGVLDLLKGTSLDEEQREYARTVEDSARSLLSLVNDLLDVSRIEAGKLEFQSIPYRPEELLRQVVQLLQPQAEYKGLALTLDVTGALPGPVLGDPDRLRQVLVNLLNNAIKFTDQGEVSVRLSLEAGPDRGKLRFEVVDTGIGIAPEDQQRLFEPFSQLESGERSRGGVGLGLSIVRHLVGGMGGDIVVESQPGQGSRFSFTLDLPLATEAVALPGAGPPGAALRGLRVLLAEDNPINRRVLHLQLKKHGLQVEGVEDGEQVLARLAQSSYDVILMDCRMPRVDGYEAARRIRAREGESGHALIVALTAEATPDVPSKCREAGMDEYVSKPVDVECLLKLLHRLLPAPGVERDASARGDAGHPRGAIG